MSAYQNILHALLVLSLLVKEVPKMLRPQLARCLHQTMATPLRQFSQLNFLFIRSVNANPAAYGPRNLMGVSQNVRKFVPWSIVERWSLSAKSKQVSKETGVKALEVQSIKACGKDWFYIELSCCHLVGLDAEIWDVVESTMWRTWFPTSGNHETRKI